MLRQRRSTYETVRSVQYLFGGRRRLADRTKIGRKKISSDTKAGDWMGRAALLLTLVSHRTVTPPLFSDFTMTDSLPLLTAQS